MCAVVEDLLQLPLVLTTPQLPRTWDSSCEQTAKRLVGLIEAKGLGSCGNGKATGQQWRQKEAVPVPQMLQHRQAFDSFVVQS